MKLIDIRRTISRVVAPALLAVGGVCLILLAAIDVPSFWYFPCFCALPVVAGFWVWRPSVGAALSVGPLISIAALLQYLSGVWLVLVLIGLIAIIACIVATVKEFRPIPVPLAVSLAFLFTSFFVDRHFTNQVVIRSYQVNVSLDGDAPWGTVGPQWSDGLKPLVLFRRVPDGYCYVAFESKQLRERLATKNSTSVPMQVNILKDFGTERGYNVRSVDGLLLAVGTKVVIDAERFGGRMLDQGVTTASSNDTCW